LLKVGLRTQCGGKFDEVNRFAVTNKQLKRDAHPGIELAKAFASERLEPPNDIVHSATLRSVPTWKTEACRRATAAKAHANGNGFSSELNRGTGTGVFKNPWRLLPRELRRYRAFNKGL